MNSVPPAGDDAPATEGVAIPMQRLPDIEHVAAAALGAFMASPELRAAALGAMPDDEIVVEYNRRHITFEAKDLSDEDIQAEYNRRNFIEDEDILKERIAVVISEHAMFTCELLALINEYELDSDQDRAKIRDLCENAGLKLADETDYSAVVRAASFVAFGSFSSWSADISELREEFARLGITHQSAVD